MRHTAQRYAAWCMFSAFLFLFALTFVSFVRAQVPPAKAQSGEVAPADTFQLPSDPANWANTAPLTTAALDGKGAVLWFYEEDCPRCRGKWPSMVELSKKYEDRPVVFIAVNSGNARPAVQAYLKQVKVAWPGIVDPTRQFEQAAGVNEISLQNIYQVKILTPKGKLQPARWDDLDGAVQLALKGAAWKIDPDKIPESLKPTWRAVEFGNYTAASAAIKKALASSDQATKSAGEALMGLVQPKIDAAIADAKASMEQGDKVGALKQYTNLPLQFTGFTLPPEVEAQRKLLEADPQVRATKKATKDLEAVRRLLPRVQLTAIRKQAETLLKQVIRDVPGTEMAKEAEELLKNLNSGTPAQ